MHAQSQYCSLYSFPDLSVHTDRRTCLDRLGIYILYACYILSDESSIPFYSTNNGYKNHELWHIGINRFSVACDRWCLFCAL